MGEWNFNRKQCIRALIKLGFELDHHRGGIHDKYTFPKEFSEKLETGHRPFIMIPRHNELRLQHKIVKKIRNIGGDELVERFKQSL